MVTLREIQDARRQSTRALTDFTRVLRAIAAVKEEKREALASLARVIKAAAHQVETQPKGWGDW